MRWVSSTAMIKYNGLFVTPLDSTAFSPAQSPTPAPRMGSLGLPDHISTLSDDTTQVTAGWRISKADPSCRVGFVMLALSERARAAGNREGAIGFIERAFRSFDGMRLEKGVSSQ